MRAGDIERRLMLGVLIVWAVGVGGAQTVRETALTEDAATPDVTIYPGTDEAAHRLSEGWSHAEGRGERSFRWITELEADVRVELEHIRPMHFSMKAAIPHVHWRRQRIGLFVNARYVTEWQAPDDHYPHVYEATIPATYLHEGLNRITLRMAYRTRIGADHRKLALAVYAIHLRGD